MLKRRIALMSVIGTYLQKYNDLLGINFPCGDIYQSEGLIHHINKNHPDCVEHYKDIHLIISEPDYISYNVNQKSCEFIKMLDEYFLAAVRINQADGTLFVATLYSQTKDKVLRKINSGKYIKL